MSATAYSHYPLKNPGNTYIHIHSTRLKSTRKQEFLQFQWIRYKIFNYVTN